jgi:hypothetical protein
MNKKNIAIIISIIIVAGVSFYGGTIYKPNRNSALAGNVSGAFANLSLEERQARMQQFGSGAAGGQRGGRANGGFIAGEIISKDDKTITVKLSDGGSKIIILSASTNITKAAAGSLDDLKVGESLAVSGSANQDGSVTAQTIQLRSNMK